MSAALLGGLGAGAGSNLAFNMGFGSGSSTTNYNNTQTQNLANTGSSQGNQSTSVQGLSPTELAYLGGVNPSATNLGYMTAPTASGISGLGGMLQGGMQASPQQLAYLQSIMGNQIGATNTALQYQMNNPNGELNTINQQLANSGMTESSVAPWMYGGAMQSYLSQLGQASQNAAAQYGQNAVQLPYQTAQAYGSLANLGQSQQNLNANTSLGAFNSLYAGNLASKNTNFGTSSQATQKGTVNNKGTQTTTSNSNNMGFSL